MSAMVASPRSKRASTTPPLFTLKPGSFQVYLIVDTSEVWMKKRRRKRKKRKKKKKEEVEGRSGRRKKKIVSVIEKEYR